MGEAQTASLPPLKPVEGIEGTATTPAPAATTPVPAAAPTTTQSPANALPPLADKAPAPAAVEPNVEGTPVVEQQAKPAEGKSIQDQITEQIGDKSKLTGFNKEILPELPEQNTPGTEASNQPDSEESLEVDEDDNINPNMVQKVMFGISVIAFCITLLVFITSI